MSVIPTVYHKSFHPIIFCTNGEREGLTAPGVMCGIKNNTYAVKCGEPGHSSELKD